MKKKVFLYIVIAIILIGVIIGLCSVKKNNLVKYEIITNEDIVASFDLDEKTKGYELKEIDGDYYVLISYGMQPAYYSTLDVENVEFKNNELIITVKLPNEGIEDAFSYPYVLLKFSRKVPENISVIYK